MFKCPDESVFSKMHIADAARANTVSVQQWSWTIPGAEMGQQQSIWGGVEITPFVVWDDAEKQSAQPPKPYRVRPCLFKAYTTSNAVTVLRRACSVYVTASLMTFSRKTCKQQGKTEHCYTAHSIA